MPTDYNVRFVAPSGSNSNDGLTLATAKFSVIAAIDSLPTAGGTIYVTMGSTLNDEVSGGGIWLDGSGGTLPSGWRAPKNLYIKGYGGNWRGYANGNCPVVGVIGGDNTDNNHPLIWITNSTAAIVIEGIGSAYPGNGIRLGVDRNGQDTMTAFVTISNVAINIYGTSSTPGPNVEIGSQSFWCRLVNHCAFNSNSNATTADKRAAIVARGSLEIADANISGNIQFHCPPGGTWGLLARNITFEGNFTDPLYNPINIIGNSQYGTALVEFCTTSDAPGTLATVVVDQGPADTVVCIGCDSVSGPATVMGSLSNGTQARTLSPMAGGQTGLFGGNIVAKTDIARRQMPPTAIRWKNLIANAHDPTQWSSFPFSVSPGATVTPSVGPNGASVAGTLTGGDRFFQSALGTIDTIATGDYVFIGAWMKVPKPPGFPQGPVGVAALACNAGPITLVGGGNSLTLVPKWIGNGEWQWFSSYGKVAAVPSPCVLPSVNLDIGTGTTLPSISVFMPTIVYVPNSEMSDNEAADFFLSFNGYDDRAPVGSMSVMPGNKLLAPSGLGVGGSANVNATGSIIKKLPIYNESGVLLGYMPIYDAL